MKKEEIDRILDKYGLPIGFGGWKINVTKDKNKKEVGDDLACVAINMYAKTIELFLSPDFYKKCDKDQENILIHELVHARVQLKQLRLAKLENQEEELMVNDMVNCVEEAGRK